MTARAYFVSDLHKFSRRSEAERHEEALRRCVVGAEELVLGGDIFDFRWSVHGERTVDQAVAWLGDLAGANPACRIHYVLGNHDCNARFVAALDDLAANTANLHWRRFYLRMGSAVFLHGDAVDRPHNCHQQLSLARAHWSREERRGVVAHWLYDLAVAARLHHVAKLVNRRTRVVSRLTQYLPRIGHAREHGVQDVYFGHTHVAMDGYEHAGMRFHNPGAPMKGLEFRIVPVR